LNVIDISGGNFILKCFVWFDC